MMNEGYMGENKEIRRKLEGQYRALQEHLEKIAKEKIKARPNLQLIEAWEKTIRNIRSRIDKLERRLKR